MVWYGDALLVGWLKGIAPRHSGDERKCSCCSHCDTHHRHQPSPSDPSSAPFPSPLSPCTSPSPPSPNPIVPLCRSTPPAMRQIIPDSISFRTFQLTWQLHCGQPTYKSRRQAGNTKANARQYGKSTHLQHNTCLIPLGKPYNFSRITPKARRSSGKLMRCRNEGSGAGFFTLSCHCLPFACRRQRVRLETKWVAIRETVASISPDFLPLEMCPPICHGAKYRIIGGGTVRQCFFWTRVQIAHCNTSCNEFLGK